MELFRSKVSNILGRHATAYERLNDSTTLGFENKDSVPTKATNGQPMPLHTSMRHVGQTLPWVLCLALVVALSVSITHDHMNHYNPALGGLRPTDFKASAKHIEQQIVTFTGSPVFDANGTFYVPHPSKERYTGQPSPEIDDNWERLTAGRYFLVTEEEAIEAFGEAPDSYWNDKVGGYTAGIDMFHALHCLNRLRQALWPEYYPREKQMGNTRIHRDHCIDHIRQMLMCAGDMTLIPTEWTAQLGHNYVQADVPHTCRNFDKLHAFVQSRRYGPDAVQESSERKHDGSSNMNGHQGG